MARFGVIGTNMITDRFLEAARLLDDFCLTAVYSRNRETGEAFAARYGGVKVYTSLEELASSPEVDAVYVASPNSCHCEQSVLMMNGGKHVLCEKPVASDQGELEQMLAAATQNHVVFLEAMRPVYDPGFAKIKELLPQVGTVRSALFQYCKYSSRYDKFKQGIIMNAFNPALSNAALMDIGVYCVHPMVRLFGMPETISAQSIFLDNGMEGMGTVIAGYGDMQAVLQYSKISNSSLPSQIQGEDGSMVIREIQNTREIELHLRNKESQVIRVEKQDNNMYYEAEEFIRLIKNGEDGSGHNQYSMMEMKVMDEIREIAGIKFGE